MLADLERIGYPRGSGLGTFEALSRERGNAMYSDYGLICNLWDFTSEPEAMLERVLGEVGLDHVTVPVVGGATESFRWNGAQPDHVFTTEGGWHYPPGRDSYKGGTIKPRAARWPGKRDLLAKLSEYLGQRGVKLIARVDLRSVAGLLEHEPHLRTRNAWGEENPAAGACVLSADLRELLRDTLSDLQQYAPAGIQLVDWMADLAVSRGTLRQFWYQPRLQHLSEICFCPACRQSATSAGVDPDQAARSVRVHIEQFISTPEEYSIRSLNEDEVLRAYLEARRSDTCNWLEHLADSFGDQQRWMLSNHWLDRGRWLAPETALADLKETAFTPVFRYLNESLDQVKYQEAVISPAAERELEQFGIVLPVWYPFVKQAKDLVRTVAELTNAGVSPLDFEGIEQAPSEAIDWLRQAVRFARRS